MTSHRQQADETTHCRRKGRHGGVDDSLVRSRAHTDSSPLRDGPDGAERQRLNGADEVARTGVGAPVEPSGLANHGRTPIQAHRTDVNGER